MKQNLRTPRIFIYSSLGLVAFTAAFNTASARHSFTVTNRRQLLQLKPAMYSMILASILCTMEYHDIPSLTVYSIITLIWCNISHQSYNSSDVHCVNLQTCRLTLPNDAHSITITVGRPKWLLDMFHEQKEVAYRSAYEQWQSGQCGKPPKDQPKAPPLPSLCFPPTPASGGTCAGARRGVR